MYKISGDPRRSQEIERPVKTFQTCPGNTGAIFSPGTAIAVLSLEQPKKISHQS